MNARGHYGRSGSYRVGGPDPVQIDPRFAARRRAVRAIFDMYANARAPYYVYAEVNGIVDKRAVGSADEATAIFTALSRAPGEVYVAVFDVADTAYWPGPSQDVYRAAPSERSTIAGATDQASKKSAGSDVWTILKFGAWAVLGVGTIVAVSSVVSNLRSGKDPAKTYVDLFRGRRRADQARAGVYSADPWNERTT